jgi:hypothetical protein
MTWVEEEEQGSGKNKTIHERENGYALVELVVNYHNSMSRLRK